MGEAGPSAAGLGSMLARFVFYFTFWAVIAGVAPADLAAGALAAMVATVVSLRLMPPSPGRVRPVLVARLALRFLRQSVVAGVDVAWRALHPRLPLHPGFVPCDLRSAGRARGAFCTMTSLLPGTLPMDVDEQGRLMVHCLDVTQPVAVQLRHEEELFVAATGGGTPP